MVTEVLVLLFLALLVSGLLLVYFCLPVILLSYAFLYTHAIALALAIWHHPLLSLAYGAGYFLSGALWSVIKWYFEETARVRTRRLEWELAPRGTWEQYRDKYRTTVSGYRTEFMAWVAFWPFSLVYTLLNDPFRRLCRRIVDELTGVYQRITDYAWR
jgi:hypothetical protein